MKVGKPQARLTKKKRKTQLSIPRMKVGWKRRWKVVGGSMEGSVRGVEREMGGEIGGRQVRSGREWNITTDSTDLTGRRRECFDNSTHTNLTT